MEGTVKFFNENKGFGFIVGDDTKEYFVHTTEVTGDAINEGDRVTFQTEEDNKGAKAVDVKKSDKQPPKTAPLDEGPDEDFDLEKINQQQP